MWISWWTPKSKNPMDKTRCTNTTSRGPQLAAGARRAHELTRSRTAPALGVLVVVAIMGGIESKGHDAGVVVIVRRRP